MIREAAQDIFNRNTDYSQPHQVVNQLESLNVMSLDLYTDAYRFVYELLQNADDSADNGQKVRVAIRLIEDYLIVAHTGKPFDERDLNGVCGVNHGTKKNAPNKTGFKGIGFKAVFGQSEKVIVYSGGEYFRFDASYVHPWRREWGGSKEAWEKESDRTFAFPWHIIPIYTQVEEVPDSIHQFLTADGWTVATIVKLKAPGETSAAVAKLSEQVNMFLFLKNIEDIHFSIGHVHRITIDREPNNVVIMKLDEVEAARWLMRRIPLTVPDSLKKLLATNPLVPEKLKNATQIELTLSAKIGENGLQPLPKEEPQLYAYLPTEEHRYHIPVLANAAFLTGANRQTLHADSLWNAWLFENIAFEIFRWTAELVTSSWSFQAYRILPDRCTQSDLLSEEYNKGFDKALNELPFVISDKGAMMRIREAVVDFTFLSLQSFVGKDKIRQYLVEEGRAELARRPFVPNTGSGNKLKHLGAASFEWAKFKELLTTDLFRRDHSVTSNMSLIELLKACSEAPKPTEVNDGELKRWKFLLNQHGQLKAPGEIFFPSPDDLVQNNPDSDVSFIHPSIHDALAEKPQVQQWLSGLGVVEKSDLSYLEKIIIPQAETFVTNENATDVIRFVYRLFRSGDIDATVVHSLRKIRLLTKNGSLVTAEECYFSANYQPRLPLEEILNIDFYISETYLPTGADVPEWRRFFKILGVQEGIEPVKCEDRTDAADLATIQIAPAYVTHVNAVLPYRHLPASEFTGVMTLLLLSQVQLNVTFARLFWQDTVRNTNPTDLLSRATAYWGYSNMSGFTTGTMVTNYLSWFLTQHEVVPTKMSTLRLASEVFLNSEENLNIAGKYLPVFDGEELSSDWKSFFRFKSDFTLVDYLALLSGIADDATADNKRKIQAAFEYFLTNFPNWSTEEQKRVTDWTETGRLLCEDGNYVVCEELAYYMDGDNSIFQDAYRFVYIAKAHRQHSNIEQVLTLFGVSVLRQDRFLLEATNSGPSISLQKRINERLPYLAKWMERGEGVRFEQMYQELLDKLTEFTIDQAEELSISDGNKWARKVSVHFANSTLTVSVKWTSAKTMLVLPTKLCQLLGAKGYDDELRFLLTADQLEVEEHFSDEGIELPPDATIANETEDTNTANPTPHVYIGAAEPKIKLDYPAFLAANLVNNQSLITQANGDASALLLNGLQAQHPGAPVEVYHFSHLENAVAIIQQGAIKSRATAEFQDSAGGGIIKHTDDERKEFARFYFRPKTPTQYYVENFGRGQQSILALGDEPVCPIPVFFIIPLEEALKLPDWNVSLGSLASSEVKFGNSFDLVSQFNFADIFKDINEVALEKFKVVAHQEFLMKDKLDLTGINYRLGVQDENAKQALLAMLGEEEKWSDKITVVDDFYHGQNPRVVIEALPDVIKATFNHSGYEGMLILQQLKVLEWQTMKSTNVEQFHHEEIVTTIGRNEMFLATMNEGLIYNLFYCYKGRNWLIHTNNNSYRYNNGYVKAGLTSWLSYASEIPMNVIKILKSQPILKYWFGQPMGGPDGLNLEQHTVAVIENYQTYYKGQQRLFENEASFFLLLALHDIGKPSAVASGDKTLQHNRSLLIVNSVRDCLPIGDEDLEMIKTAIDGDIIGAYMNPKFNVALDVTIADLVEQAGKFLKPLKEIWSTLVIYYQCDAAGYRSLHQIFATNESDEFIFSTDGSRLLFKEKLEEKFQALEAAVQNM